jgi:hypothetical protein
MADPFSSDLPEALDIGLFIIKQIRFDHQFVLYLEDFWLYISHVDIKLGFYNIFIKNLYVL